MGKREVTEADFRMAQYRDAKPEDYEFRDDGALVRKDRWERAVRDIAAAIGYESRGGFEIECVVHSVELLVKAARAAGLPVYALDELPQ